ncbi:MAG TPA: C40 family peptidase [Rhodocyclaceae bacterium]|nr:C40 family peptidase [Rhodocyclaceae bacterium]
MILRPMFLLTMLLLSGCGSISPAPEKSAVATRLHGGAEDVVMFALGLIDTNYRFGGRNPDAGFDCSGMVSYVFDRAAGLRLTGSAADMARKGRPVEASELKPGDLVFFNTLNRPRSHVGIYIGDGRFVHAPSRQGQAKVRTDSLTEGYFASRFEEARSYFD